MRPEMGLAALLCLAPQPAAALLCGTVLDPLTVAATPMIFGNYTATSQNALTANATVTINCGLLNIDLLPDFTVSLSRGSNSSSFAPRTMKKDATTTLNYNIYTTSGFTNIWGDGTGGSVSQQFQALLQLGQISFTAFGRIPTAQFVPAATYSDTITVTVSW